MHSTIHSADRAGAATPRVVAHMVRSAMTKARGRAGLGFAGVCRPGRVVASMVLPFAVFSVAI
ncbi:hypothetical protein IDVR_01810 [Intrasporangium sp. DVR]